MKSALSNQVLKKYVGSRKIKEIHNVVIPVCNQHFRWDGHKIYIIPLKVSIPFDAKYYPKLKCIKSLELTDEYLCVFCEVYDTDMIVPEGYLGVDRNATSHVCVVANPDTGKCLKLGKEAPHIIHKYANLRAKAESRGSKKNHHWHRASRKLKHRQAHKVLDINHKISKEIVDTAAHDKCAIVLEDLKNIRRSARKSHKTKKGKRVFSKLSKGLRYTLNSWPFYQLQQLIVYKAQLQGIPVIFVDPAYTSQRCSRCGEIGLRDGKDFKCPHCGHADHADVNAAFNIAVRGRLHTDRAVCKGSTDAPNGAL